MYVFKLYERDDTEHAVDARFLQDGLLRLGRDPAADWVILDPERQMSRWHCEFRAAGDALTLTCIGANGVFNDPGEERLPDHEEIPIEVPCAFTMGRYRLVADRAPQGGISADEGQTLVLSPPLGTSIAVPTEWDEPPTGRQGNDQGSLLEAFCEGAGLDASAFSAEDPEQVMRRAGAVYRQMVLGIGDLMAERERARSRYQIARTTIGGAHNNPFKWAPKQRLALDLLLEGKPGFLTGPAALAASFRDIKKHLICTFSGFRATIREAVATFDPSVVDMATRDRVWRLQGRGATLWEESCRRHAELAREIEQGEKGALDQVFTRAYDDAATALEGEGK